MGRIGTIGNTLNNRYRLDKLIGEGGFAQVFLAFDLELGRLVAVKVLDQDWIKDKDLLTRFRNEARAVAVLDHPHILQIFDYGVARGAPYIVMPYVSGGTFSARMKQGPFTLDEIGFYLDQIASALDYAHQHAIVHRDIKPTNLLMRADGQLVLMDFGLAKLLSNVDLEEQTVVVGTVAYMAPEQFHGLVSAASDIYVLGVLLYQMLAGKLPFEGNTTEILVGHVHLEPASLSALIRAANDADLPRRSPEGNAQAARKKKDQPTMRSIPPAVVQALDEVLKKALAKHAADRYPTCQALCTAYYQALKADPHRAASNDNHDNNFQKRDLKQDRSGTVLSDKPLIARPTPTESANERRDRFITPAADKSANERRGRFIEPTADLSANEVEVKPDIKLPPAAQPPKQPGAAYPDATIIDPLIIPPVAQASKPTAAFPDATIIEPLIVPPAAQPPKQPGAAYPDATIIDPLIIPPAASRGTLSGGQVMINHAPTPDATIITPAPSQRKKILLKPPRLLVTTEPDKGFQATFDLAGESLTLGRATDNNFCVPLSIISRYHALFTQLNNELQEPSYKIVQRKSVNSLWFKGKEVSEKVLEHGDTIEIGQRGFAEYIVKLTYQGPEYGFL